MAGAEADAEEARQVRRDRLGQEALRRRRQQRDERAEQRRNVRLRDPEVDDDRLPAGAHVMHR